MKKLLAFILALVPITASAEWRVPLQNQTFMLNGLICGGGIGCIQQSPTFTGTFTLQGRTTGSLLSVDSSGVVTDITPTDDRVLVAGASSWVKTAIGDCDDTGGNHLNYDTTTNAFTCGTSSGSAGANTALSNLASVAINTALLPDAAAADDFGSATLPFKDFFLAGSSGTPGTNNFKLTGASTSGTRVITFPDATTTLSGNAVANVFTQTNTFGSAAGAANSLAISATGTITVEGSDDANETTITFTDPGADVTLELGAPSATTFVVGSETNPTNTFILGEGATSTTVSDVTIKNSAASGTDKAGASTTIAAGTGTGTGYGGNAVMSAQVKSTTTGTTAGTVVPRVSAIGHSIALTDNSATTVLTCTMTTLTGCSLFIHLTVAVDNGTDVQMNSSFIAFAAVDKGGTVTAQAARDTVDANAASGATTLTVGVGSTTGTDTASMTVTANTSLNVPLQARLEILAGSSGVVTFP